MAAEVFEALFRQTMFGPEPQVSRQDSGMKSELRRIRGAMLSWASQLSIHDSVSETIDQFSASLVDPVSQTLRRASTRRPSHSEKMTKVVLMGRTTAGKSTIFECLCGGDGSRQGRGGQRTTRKVANSYATSLGWSDLMVVDTPGVGALDGAVDREMALSTVADADLILWVASNDQHQTETTDVLRLLALQGKPIIVAINCRYTIDHRNGYLNADGLMFLRHPSLAFDEVDAHAAILRRHLAVAGLGAVPIVAIHARAAFLSTSAGEHAGALRRRSRIADLTELLAQYRKSVLRAQLAVLREVDKLREPILEAQVGLARAVASADAALRRRRDIATDRKRRMGRACDRVERRLLADLVKPIDARRAWHLSADPGKGVRQRWRAVAQELGHELEGVLDAASENYRKAIGEAWSQTTADWESLPIPDLDEAHLTGFGSVLHHRIAKYGMAGGLAIGGTMLAGAVAGAVKGGVSGSFSGPLGALAGAVTGAIVGGVGAIVARQIGNIFKGKDRVLRERRQQLGSEVKRLLDQLSAELQDVVAKHALSVRAAIDTWFEDETAAVRSGEAQVQAWSVITQAMARQVETMDAATAKSLLILAGRNRAALGVVRATRNASAVIVEMSEPAFSEYTLVPLAESPVPIVAAPLSSRVEGGQSLNAMAQFCPEAICIQFNSHGVAFEAPTELVSPEIAEAWSALLSQFCGAPIQVISVQTTDAEGQAVPGGPPVIQQDPRKEAA